MTVTPDGFAGRGWASERQRTAIGRSALSMPARLALRDGLISHHRSVLDYGCGRGQDVARLRRLGHHVNGWDPHYLPDGLRQPHDVVLLTYVLNVIEHRSERVATLRDAWTRANRVLVVSVRLTWDMRRVQGEALHDGTLTSRSTFQHLYSTAELRTLVEEATGCPTTAPSPGVVYVFKRNEDRLEHIARMISGRDDWMTDGETVTAVERLVGFAESRGRPPHFDEIPRDILPALAQFSGSQLRALVLGGARPEALERGARRQVLDVLLYLGIAMFSGRTRLVDLSLSLQMDVRHHFSSFRDACRRAERLLLKLRDDTYLRGAMRNSPGKMTPTALYVHHSALAAMPVVLRLYEHCGAVAAGRPLGWNILKLHHDTRRVAYSAYPEFERDPHPRLDWTYGVDLTSLTTTMQDFRERSNRPLLHRKHEFLAGDHPDAPKYQRLTASEVKAGLYSDPSRIGLEVGWRRELERCGVELRGHRLVRSRLEA